MEKPGIEPATPGLQGIALIHYTTEAHQGHWQSVYIEMNGILPVKKMNNLTKLNIKLFRICLYHYKDKTLNFLLITYKIMAA